MGTGLAIAGPNGATVVGGSATIQGQGTASVTINQASQNTVINWQTFNIGQGEITTFNQPNSAAIALNRVVGGQGPSIINGTLTANGRVFVINGDGILFGATAVINTAGFLATTSDICVATDVACNQAFVKNYSGKYNFNIPGNPAASIVNLGQITATSGGFAALVAPGVRNSGTITAKLGTVSLASGNSYTLDFYGDQLITLAPGDQIASQVIDVKTGQPLTSLVSNDGKLKANGGRVELTAAAARVVVDSVINNTGVIEANSVGSKNGMIVLSAATADSKPADAPAQTVKVSGTISAAGKHPGTTGGTVVVMGENIQVSGAKINASGNAGGGKVLIGGDTGGGHPRPTAAAIELAKLETFTIATATTVSVDAGTTINASATGKGNGGKVVLWSNQQTSFAGVILAKGGGAGGNGGFVETSSHGNVAFSGIVNVGAPKGTLGTILLDPSEVNIEATCDADNCVTAGSIEGALTGGNFLVATNPDADGSGNINVNAGLTWTGSGTLTLSAANNININAGISAATGGFTLNAGAAINPAAAVNVGTFILQNGNWSQVTSAGSMPAFSATDFQLQGGTFLRAQGGDGSSLNPYQIFDVYGLQGIGSLLSQSPKNQNYVLANTIDASGTANWNGGAGFVPIGSGDNTFVGSLNGAGYTIDRLTISSTAQYVGLFGYVDSGGSVSNLGLTNANITASYNAAGTGQVGSIAGVSYGTITNTFATGAVTVNVTANERLDELGLNVGGLVGTSGGMITGSYSTSTVGVSITGPTDQYHDVDANVGGLVGTSFTPGSITNSYASGPVSLSGANVLADFAVGGLVGYNSATISNAYASGPVNMTVTGASATDDSGTSVGGLVGANYATVSYAYATGAVTVSIDQNIGASVGGLIGYNNGSVTQTYATGAMSVAGSARTVGALIGSNDSGGNVTQSYFDSTISGKLPGIGSDATDGSDVNPLGTAGFSTASNFKSWNFGSSAGACADGGACWVIIDSNGSLNNASGSGATRPFLLSEYSTTISNSHQLQLAVLAPGATYTLANDIALGADLQNPSSMWGQAGFVPIGNISFGGFTGSFDGQNHTIAGLTIAPTDSSVNNIGLFGTIFGSVSNLTLSNASITVNPNVGLPGQFVGVLAGQNGGTITNVNVTSGTVNGLVGDTPPAGVIAGGLVGQNGVFFSKQSPGNVDSASVQPAAYGTITQSSASVNVTLGNGVSCFNTPSCLGGLNLAGGLVGSNNGTITSSSALGLPNGEFYGVAEADSRVTISAGTNSLVGGLVGANDGAIANSLATVNVSVVGAANSSTGANINPSFAGGLVGQNGNGGTPAPIATITSSYATASVTGTGVNLAVGGLVGDNAAGSFIANSQAFGKVAANTNLVASSQSSTFVAAGGLVGSNEGTIGGSAPPPAPPTPPQGGDSGIQVVDATLILVGSTTAWLPSNGGCVARSQFSCAAGNVSVGALGQAGGLAGSNDGTIFNVLAVGSVTGAAGVPPSSNGNNNLTQLGGLVGINTGVIATSNGTAAYATGSVGNFTDYQEVGGLVAQNHGSIGNSVAYGTVSAGNGSTAGGFTGENSPNNDDCSGCSVGDGHNNLAIISASVAWGGVSVGANSFAGGFAGTADGSFLNVHAFGNVTGGANSVLGGLVGGMGALNGPSLINQSFASGQVTSSGANSTVGGLVGLNGGTIDGSTASGDVFGTSASYLGGLAGINVGTIQNSTANGQVTGSGANNVAGGAVGSNLGLIDPTTSSGNVSSGANSWVGQFAGANEAFNNYSAGQLLGSTFPIGTISSDSIGSGTATGGPGSSVGGQVGYNFPTATTGLPGYVNQVTSNCNNAVCTVLTNGVLYNPNAGHTPPPPPPPVTQAQVIQNLVQNITLAAVTLGEVVDTLPVTQPPRTGPGPGPTPPAPPGGLPPQFGPRFFVAPPLGETRFVQNEVVLQIPNNIPPAVLQSVLASLGLSIMGSQNMPLIGVTSYQVHIDNGQSIQSVIQALAGKQIVAGAQANYTYTLMQDQAPEPDLAGLTQGEGDAAQYTISKLGLVDIHRQLKGSNVTIAVIDSQIDVKHPDLDGDIAEQFDAVGAADAPHPHGTGMAGAIASHRRLMGIAPAARIFAVHAFSSGAATAESTTFNILKGLEWASDKGVRVINMSFAGPRDPSIERALNSAHDRGIVLIAAAGNAGPKSPPLFPGAGPNVIAVTATDINDKLFSGANRGKYIAVAAPGVDILVPAPDNTYQLTTGTSVASAEVSGIAALLLERNPNLGPEDIRKVLTSSARSLGSNDDFGSGLVDPSKAIQTAGDYRATEIATGAVPVRAPVAKPQTAPPATVRPPGLTSAKPSAARPLH